MRKVIFITVIQLLLCHAISGMGAPMIYIFNGTVSDDYTNPSNWDSVNGYPGLTISNTELVRIVADCVLSENQELKNNGELDILDDKTFINRGKIVAELCRIRGSLINEGIIEACSASNEISNVINKGVISGQITILIYENGGGGRLQPRDPITSCNTSIPFSAILIEEFIDPIGDHKTIFTDVTTQNSVTKVFGDVTGIVEVQYQEGFIPQPNECHALDLFGGNTTIDSVVFPDIIPLQWSYGNEGGFWAQVSNPPQINNALDFDGVDDDCAIRLNENGTPKILTIEFSFLPRGPLSNTGMILSHETDAFQYVIIGPAFGGIEDETISINGAGGRLHTTKPLSNDWYHVAIVSTDGVRYDKIYVDGIEVTEPGYTGPLVFESSQYRIGSRNEFPQGYTRAFYRGRIDEVRLWHSTRSSEQIMSYSDRPLRENPNLDVSALIAYYDFDEMVAYEPSTCTDFSEYWNRHEFLTAGFGYSQGTNFSNVVDATACPGSIINNTLETGSNWHNRDNWSIGKVPTACHSVILTAPMVEVKDRDAFCGSLEVLEETNLEITKRLTVYNSVEPEQK